MRFVGWIVAGLAGLINPTLSGRLGATREAIRTDIVE